ncbi:MAG: 1-acyl-sn-glycerol-3-phosphate acyltransferase [Candidatus Kapabacteria bacterium]|nr:1-acyl-sn-glycerol-3-phosphate acyltransferase [Candidatus Kapabacteria bacterium]
MIILRFLGVIFLTVYYGVRVYIYMRIQGNKSVFTVQAMDWAKKLLSICGVTLTVNNIYNTNLENDFVIVPNHTSLLDIPVLIATIPNIRIMYKRDLEKVPIFGWIMKNSPYIAIDREDPKKALITLQQTIESMKEGSSVVVFPEGTRAAGEALGEFKRGAFYLAIKAQKPILPVSIVGTHKVLPNSSIQIRPNPVTLNISKSIEINDSITKTEEKNLISEVHSIISNLMTYDATTFELDTSS